MNEKFRPAFSIPEIQYIIDLCNLDARHATGDMGVNIANRLKIFVLKGELGLVNPAFTSAPILSLESKLGLDNLEEKRLAAHKKWVINPAICTEEEKMLSKTYRYENNLMSEEQEREYEKL